MPSGIEYTDVIDVIAHDPRDDTVTLIMQESRPWDGSDQQLFQLQEKINTYLSFALDGEMHEEYPQFQGKPLRLQLDCHAVPDERTRNLLQQVRDQIAFQEIDFQVRVFTHAAPGQDEAGATGCGGGCQCHSH